MTEPLKDFQGNRPAPRPTRIVNGLQVLDLPDDSPVVTTEHVRRITAEQ